MTNEQLHAVQEMGSTGFRVLLICFILIIVLAVMGAVFQWLTGVENDIFRDAMRLIGIGGPTGTASNAAADAVKTWRVSAPATPATPATTTPALASTPWKDGGSQM